MLEDPTTGWTTPDIENVNKANNLSIENICRELARAFQGVLLWKWDKRFETVLAEFSVQQEGEIRATLKRYLNLTWDSAAVGNAPDIVRNINDNLGGLRQGQYLFTSDPHHNGLVFCTWWPWGDGKEISIRIGAASKNVADSDHDDHLQQFRSWFGV